MVIISKVLEYVKEVNGVNPLKRGEQVLQNKCSQIVVSLPKDMSMLAINDGNECNDHMNTFSQVELVISTFTLRFNSISWAPNINQKICKASLL